MNDENNLGVSSINVVESFYQPIKDQQKLYGDRKYNFLKENNVDTAELIGIQRDPNATLLQLTKDDPNKEENNPFFVKDLVNFVSDIPDQAMYRIALGGMNAARLGVNLMPTISRLMGSEPGEDNFEDTNKFAINLDNKLKTGIENFKQLYGNSFQSVKGREPSTGADLVSYIAQDYPFAAPIYKTLDKIGIPKTFAIPLAIGLSTGVAFDPKTDESTFFFDSEAIKGLREYFNALPDTPEGEVFDRAYQTFETTGLAAAIGPIIKTALFLKRNVPAFNKSIPGAAVATGSATAIGEITDKTILNPQDETIQNQEPTILDNVRGGIDQFGNKLTEIGGAIKKEFSGEAQANPLVTKGINELTPVFRSAVVDAVNKIPNKAPGNQILGTIKNIPGVTQQEMKWIGLDDFLKDKPSLTKQEVSDFIQANRLDVNEVMFPRTTKAKRTDEEIKEFFLTQSDDGESAYYAYQDIKEALESNAGLRFDDIKYKIKNGGEEYAYNTNTFLNEAALWDDYYESNTVLSYSYFKRDFAKTFKITDIFDETKINIIKQKDYESLMSNFFREVETSRSLIDVPNYSISQLKNVLLTTDDYSKFKNYLKDRKFTPKTEEIIIDENNLKKLHNEYIIRVREDDLDSRFNIDTNMIDDFVGGTTSAKYSNYTLPGGANYKELVFTLSKGGKNVGKNFPLQQGATTKQTVDNLSLNTSAHFNIDGEFAHVRFKERQMAGQKTLAVEELQSDLFQQVKQKNKSTIKLAKERASNTINIDQTARNSFENVTEQEILQKAQSEIDDKTIKDFPFKNNWYELVTRRLIRYAADNNFSAIAIPEGRVAASRYGKIGGFVDNLDIKVFPSYTREALNDAKKGGFDPLPNYQFTVTYKSGDREIQKRVLADESMYKLQDDFPKAFGMFGGDLESVLLHRYTPEELKKQTFSYKFEKPEFAGEGKGKFELYDQAIPGYIKKYAKKWNAPVNIEQELINGQNINYLLLKITPEMKKSVQEKSQPLFNIVLPALGAGGGAKAVSENMRNNTISDPTKIQ